MENILVGVVFVAVLLFIAFLLVVIFTDEVQEQTALRGRQPRRIGDITGLNAKMYLSLGIFAFAIAFMGYYWITDESRRAAAAEFQIHRGEERAIHNYAKNCASCHGARGEGLVGPSLKIDELVERHGWSLDNPTDARKIDDFLVATITYGWPPVYRGDQPRMPNWGEETGGPLNAEQINELVTMIKRNVSWEETAKQVSGETTVTPGQASTPEELGQAYYSEKGCVSCHGRNLEGGIGPSLQNYSSKAQIAGVLDNTPENLAKWLENPPAVKPGTAMPNLNLTPEEVDALVQYLLQ